MEWNESYKAEGITGKLMGKIFYIMGKSSSGKDTIYENLLGREGLSLHPLIMYTTRPIRAGETDGVQYHFVTEEQLKKLNARLNHDYLPEHGLGIRVVKKIAKRYRYKTVFRSEAGSYFSCNILFPLFFKCS